ncbi:hypothetical protein EJ05DRAFT_536776 [Pseudovirgaria hyperparasitica]|uniref:Zn(2)-C6 fungal-type domain-containing protein n=1 Tax=Pseudovirgaria hyperparasitica TaxID=470096 RepID=A0A6A6W9B5_9PEZI|nr:uncharacterized protein EJ05DRAFT_536776 [Pseudovirgaria hyperparasitica]KAF2759468.1 hypothetical protein EJ05DRAFT_536776 [Pseudovirgaria hyperparasitica]
MSEMITDQHSTIDPTLLGIDFSNSQILSAEERSPSTLGESSSSSPLSVSESTLQTSEEPCSRPRTTNQLKKSTDLSRRKPIPRKGHTKSRRGCFNCKRRKIKCQENLPVCHHCSKAGLICEYPKTPVYLQQISKNTEKSVEDVSEKQARTALTLARDSIIGSCRPIINMTGTPGTFDLQDMRFFHHFLQHGYPHLPIGADEVWVTTLPAIAHQYAYLTHAIMALSASHLQALTHEDLASAALAHRLHAISSLNASLTTPAATRAEADARMATVMALTMQAVHLDDNYAEYLTLSRGCFIFGADALLDDDHSAFAGFRNDRQAKIMAERFAGATRSPCNPALLDEAIEAVNRVGELCTEEYERGYVELMLETLRAAYSDAAKAYTSFTKLFTYPSLIPQTSFTHLLSAHNPTGSLLLATHLGVQHTLIPVLLYEFRSHAPPRTHAPSRMNSWIRIIADRLGFAYEKYWAWSVRVVERPWTSLFAKGALEDFVAGWKSAKLVKGVRVREEDVSVKRGAGDILGVLDEARVREGFAELVK